MIWTVSTIRDSVRNIEAFTRRNLAGGVDHMVLVLDGHDAAVDAALAGHPHVTTVTADQTWWPDGRPDNLNDRQRINANVVLGALRVLGLAEWVFHIDGDEVLWFDADRLEALPPDVSVVRALPLEAVSRWRATEPVTTFKRLLDGKELALLQILDVVRRPRNRHYFHGHVGGKVGVRPGEGIVFGIHGARAPETGVLPAHDEEWLRLLHYDAPSGEEFVRKWTTMLSAGQQASFHGPRRSMARGLEALIRSPLTPEQAAPFLEGVFERTMMDDVDTLTALGLLIEVDPDGWRSESRPLPDDRRRDLDALLAALRGRRKQPFLRVANAGVAERIVERAAAAVGSPTGQGSA